MIYLSANKHPHVGVEIKLGDTWRTVDCLIDTGFSSGISLPYKYLSQIKTKSKWKQSFELADGSAVEYDLYKFEVRYNKKIKIISGIFSKSDDALLGIEFLDDFCFLLDLKNNKVFLS